ncbi:MAG: protein kinase [Holophagales bacterium]|nr:protein kinase [Holophagales bacterium]
MSLPARALPADRAISQYVLRTWTPREGLPGVSSYAIAQTPDGLLWMGTTDGLVRFDGFDFLLFQKHDTPAFTQNEVSYLHTDPGGALWIGLADGTLVLFEAGRFRRILTAAEGHTGRLSTLPGGDLLLSGPGTICSKKDGSIRPFPHLPERSGAVTKAAFVDRSGRSWWNATGGIAVVEPEGRTTLLARACGHDVATSASSFSQGADGDVWIAAGRVFRFRGTTCRGSWGLSGGLPAETAVRVTVDRDGNAWVGIDSHGLARIRPDGSVEKFGPADGLVGERPWAIFEDREGNLWVSTWDGGLHRFSAGAFTTWGVAEGLPHPSVRSVAEDHAGAIWAATKAGLARLGPGRVEVFPSDTRTPKGWLTALAEARPGHLVAGSHDGLWDLAGGRLTPSPLLDGWKGSWVFSLKKTADGRLWAGTGTGLLEIRPDEIEPVPGTDALVFDLFEDRASTLWAMTRKGLFRRPAGSNRLEKVESGLPATWDVFTCAAQDARGDLWFGTLDAGLFRLGTSGLRRYRTSDGLPSESFWGILTDDTGALWLKSTAGILRIRPEAFAAFDAGTASSIPFLAFGPEDGLRTTDPGGGSSPSALRARDGRLWFATSKGLSVVDPRSVGLGAAPAALLSGLKVDGLAVPREALRELPAGKHRLEIAFTALHLRDPGRLRFRYRLSPLDRDWQATTGRRVEIAALPPGRYDFEVQAGLGDRWGAPERFAVAIAPFFWQHNAVRAFGLLALGLAAWLLHRTRIRRLQRREVRLSALVDERTAELRVEQEKAKTLLLEKESARRELEARQEAEALEAFGRSVSGLLDPAGILERLDDALRDRLPHAHRLTAAVREGRPPIVLPPDDPAARPVLEALTHHPREVATFLSRFDPATCAQGEVSRALAAWGGRFVVPVVSGDAGTGLVALSPADGASISERDLAFVAGLSAQAGAALSGAWHFQEAQRWQRVSEARKDWAALDLLSRLSYAAVSRLGFGGAATEAAVLESVASAAPDLASDGGVRLRATLARLAGEGLLEEPAAGRYQLRDVRLLSLPEAGQPLEEISRHGRQRVGAYRLLDRIGVGGMGEVFRAVDLHDGTPAAVKLLFPQEGTDAEARHRLEREGEIVSALSHPNVVRLLARGEHDGRLYVAMELLEGDTVQARLQRGPLPPEDVLSAARQIASALAELHRHGVVHRDLNAANVMHVPPDRYVLLDFGLARRIDASILTAAHSILGTIPYMSPEQLRGEPLDARSDMWSLGVLLYQMATGRFPWGDETTLRMALSILRTSETGRDLTVVPAVIRPLLERLLVPEREGRATAEEIVGVVAPG